MAKRACKKCGVEKEDIDFYPHTHGFRYECKECHNMRNNIRIYGLTKEDYLSMREAQEDLCLMCKRKKKLVIDHDHKTGKIRGLLCNRCNLFLGFLENDPSLIDKARAYL